MQRLLFAMYLGAIFTFFLIVYSCSSNEASRNEVLRSDTTAMMTYRGDRYATDTQGGEFIVTGEGVEEIVNKISEKRDQENERLWAFIGSMALIIWGGLLAYIRQINRNTVMVGSKVESIALEISGISNKISRMEQWKTDMDKLCDERHHKK